MPIALTSIGTLPAACAASVWSSAPAAPTMAPISARGCSTPISLLAAITDTSTVLSVTAARNSSSLMNPSRVDAKPVTRQPSHSSFLNESSTDLCSVATVTM